MFSWIKTKAKEYGPPSTEALTTDPEDEQFALDPELAPWDIGRPQPAFVTFAQSSQLRGPVLDVGCGTGGNALYLAGLGFDVTGVDSSRGAIEIAREKGRRRHVRANFRVVDAFDLACLGTTFDTAIDSGFFHLLTDEERARFLPSLAAVVRPGGTYAMLCVSDQETHQGPRRLSRAEIESTFRTGWTIQRIQAAIFETKIHEGGAKAWLATMTRV